VFVCIVTSILRIESEAEPVANPYAKESGCKGISVPLLVNTSILSVKSIVVSSTFEENSIVYITSVPDFTTVSLAATIVI